MRLDIACGRNCTAGFDGVDISDLPGVVHVVDLSVFPWPFESGSVHEAVCNHFVEHTKDLIAFMNELGRVMRNGAVISIRAPYFTSIRCWQDPTHTRAITDATFCYFDAQWRKREGLDHYPITCDFEQVEVKHWIHEDWKFTPQDQLLHAIKTAWNVIEDIEFTLRKR